jgi:hypothetical protein
MEFEEAAVVLNAVGISEAANRPLTLSDIAPQHGVDDQALDERLDLLERMGLVLRGPAPEDPPLLLRAGRQYLAARGQVDKRTLRFMTTVFDDLNTRAAYLDASVALSKHFKEAVLDGRAEAFARELVPPAFSVAMTKIIALDLFQGTVVLLTRLSAGQPAACVAEEVVAIAILEQARRRLDELADEGQLDAADAEQASEELDSLFELFQDDDVLRLFDLVDPADAALAAQDPVGAELGVADQRLEEWFRPFWGLPPVAHLRG